jgi:hypothetical protein
VELWFAALELFGEALAVFEFVEVGGDGMGRSFTWALLDWKRSEGPGELPRAFNSLQACSQAFASRDEMYTFAPF